MNVKAYGVSGVFSRLRERDRDRKKNASMYTLL